MALLAYFAVFVLAAAHGAVGQKGFLSIDCGLEDNSGGYKDPTTGVVYVSDGPYVDAGEPHKGAADQGSGLPRAYQTLRSFPSGERNCYTLPTVAGAKYLVRVVSFYGNYDSKDGSSTLQFDLYIGVDRWTTVHADSSWLNEALFVAWASWTPVCLLKTGPASTPFVSSVELRTLASDLYPDLTANDSMCLAARYNMGTNISVIRYPNDTYDQYWWQIRLGDPTLKNLSTVLPIEQAYDFSVPLPVMQTAVETASNKTVFSVALQDKSLPKFMVYLHFADFQNSQLRQFNASGDDQPCQYTPPYLATETVRNTDWYRAPNGLCTITLAPTAASKLPPMLNAFEIYTLISHDSPRTFPKDFDTIMAIKFEYGLKKNWNGNPCFPTELAWDGLKCSITSGNTARITSVDLSNSNLHGAISKNFTLLTALEYLNLSGNRLDGRIPAGPVCKNNAGSLVFSYDGHLCNTAEESTSRNMAVILAPSIVVPVIAIAVLGLGYYFLTRRRKPIISTDHPSIEHEHEHPLASRQNHSVGALQKVENR
uniref:Malectin-like domain-containing protein n=1 Tax=Oryza brachyantha TaxID=4533 RepID=J3MWR3_ORYBR